MHFFSKNLNNNNKITLIVNTTKPLQPIDWHTQHSKSAHNCETNTQRAHCRHSKLKWTLASRKDNSNQQQKSQERKRISRKKCWCFATRKHISKQMNSFLSGRIDHIDSWFWNTLDSKMNHRILFETLSIVDFLEWPLSSSAPSTTKIESIEHELSKIMIKCPNLDPNCVHKKRFRSPTRRESKWNFSTIKHTALETCNLEAAMEKVSQTTTATKLVQAWIHQIMFSFASGSVSNVFITHTHTTSGAFDLFDSECLCVCEVCLFLYDKFPIKQQGRAGKLKWNCCVCALGFDSKLC